MIRKSAIHSISLGLLVFTLSCQSTPEATPQQESSTNPKLAAASAEPPQKTSAAERLYFQDQACPRPFSVWQSVVDLSDSDKPLAARSIWAMPGRVVRVQVEGDELVQRQLEREGQFFEELFTFGYYGQPFRSIRLAGLKTSYKATLKLTFENKPLAVGEALAVGQLFKTGGSESTRLVISLPDGKKIDEVFEWIQTAAAEQRIDHNAPLGIKAEGSQLFLENAGPRGTSSNYLVLQLKQPVDRLDVQILSERKWPSGSADAIELAFAEKQCLAESECKGVKAVSSFVPGVGAEPASDLKTLAQQLNQVPAQGEKPKAIALGKGGVIELEMDGPLLNHESSDLRIESLEQPIGCPQPAQKIRVFAKAKADHIWQPIDKEKALCFSNNLDLQFLPMARFLKIEDVSASKSGRGFELSRVKCLERVKLEVPAKAP